MAKLEVQERSASVKVVKREQQEAGARRGYARDPKDHFVNQVGLINEVVQPPWTTCFGSLGTGIVGVRPSGSDTGGGKALDLPFESESCGGADMFGARLASGHTGSSLLPLDATIIIFVAPPCASLQIRGGKATSGYKDDLDKAARSLDWSAQRNDRHNKKIEAIMAHCHGGGRVVVSVRSQKTNRFTQLGTVSHIDTFSSARFLIENGDHILQERGTRTYHKQITAACLNPGLRSGVGLKEARYPVVNGSTCKWCSACCYAPPKATLHFHELRDEGVAAYDSPAQWVMKEERERRAAHKLEERRRLAAIKTEAKLEPGKAGNRLEKAKLELDNIAVPLKRLRCKQPLKREALEPAPLLKTILDVSEGGETAGTAEEAGKAEVLEPALLLKPTPDAAECGETTRIVEDAGKPEVLPTTHQEFSSEEEVPAVGAVSAL